MATSIIAVGSKNAYKVAAVRAVADSIPALAEADCLPFGVASGVADQPMSLEETRQGALNRARAAFLEASRSALPSCEGEDSASGIIAIGIESGLFCPDGNGRHFDVCVCMATRDGDPSRMYMGLSCAFEIPPGVMRHVRQGLDLSAACNATGLTENISIGEAEGIIGILSRGRITRQAYTEQALKTCLLFVENEGLYEDRAVTGD